MDRARRAGHSGVALTADASALRTLTGGGHHELVAHERDPDRLVTDLPVRALCRYDPRERSVLLAELAAGELDAGNVDRFAEILRAEERGLDGRPERVGFLSAAGGRVLRDMVDRAGRGGPVLVLNGPTRGPARVLDLLGLAHDTGFTPDRQGVVDERA